MSGLPALAPMITIVAGSRTATREQVFAALASMPWSMSEVVSGGARGADRYGEEYAQARRLPLRIFPAEWARYGRAAGPLRNRQMAQYAQALVAVWDGQSRGTQNMFITARQLRLWTWIFDTSTGVQTFGYGTIG